MERFDTNLLDEMLEKQEEIRESNRRLSIKIGEALEASSVIRRPILDLTKIGVGSTQENGTRSEEPSREKEKGSVPSPLPAVNKRKAEYSYGGTSKAQKMTTMEEKMDLLLKRTASMVTTEDVDKIADRMEGRLKKVEENQGTFLARQNRMEARLSRIE